MLRPAFPKRASPEGVLHFLLTSIRGYWLTPWKSPYLRWRIETYSGLQADSIHFRQFWAFLWRNRRELVRFLRWTSRMR